MDIAEMHSVFRVLGQQMGIQLVRGILDESIDVYLNATITEKVHNDLLTGVHTVFQEQVDTQPSTMSPSNLFRTLFRVHKLTLSNDNNLDTNVVDNDSVEKEGYYKIKIPSKGTDATIHPMLYLGFSLLYNEEHRDKRHGCRMLGADVLETTMRDFCNAATWDSPIAVLLSETYDENNALVDTDNIKNEYIQEYVELYTNTPKDKRTPETLFIKYIKTPNKVKYDATDSNNCIDCDLPAYCHFEIVEKAVLKFYQSINGYTVSSNNRKNSDD